MRSNRSLSGISTGAMSIKRDQADDLQKKLSVNKLESFFYFMAETLSCEFFLLESSGEFKHICRELAGAGLPSDILQPSITGLTGAGPDLKKYTRCGWICL